MEKPVKRTHNDCTYYIPRKYINMYTSNDNPSLHMTEDKFTKTNLKLTLNSAHGVHSAEIPKLNYSYDADKTQETYDTWKKDIITKLIQKYNTLKPCDKRKGYHGRFILENKYFLCSLDRTNEYIIIQIACRKTDHKIYQHNMLSGMSKFLESELLSHFPTICIPTGQFTVMELTKDQAVARNKELEKNKKKAYRKRKREEKQKEKALAATILAPETEDSQKEGNDHDDTCG